VGGLTRVAKAKQRTATAKSPAEPPVQLVTFALDKLKPYERNPRKNDSAVPQMMRSIIDFGFKIPILAKSDGSVIDGHLRLKAAKQLGIKEVPAIICDDWSEGQIKAFRLLVNRSVNWAAWDTDLLKTEMEELHAMEFDLALTGFDAIEIDRFLGIAPVETPKSAGAIGDMEYRIIVECANEHEQTQLLDKFDRDGLKCKALVS